VHVDDFDAQLTSLFHLRRQCVRVDAAHQRDAVVLTVDRLLHALLPRSRAAVVLEVERVLHADRLGDAHDPLGHVVATRQRAGDRHREDLLAGERADIERRSLRFERRRFCRSGNFGLELLQLLRRDAALGTVARRLGCGLGWRIASGLGRRVPRGLGWCIGGGLGGCISGGRIARIVVVAPTCRRCQGQHDDRCCSSKSSSRRPSG
jgi:hypothetical protein